MSESQLPPYSADRFEAAKARFFAGLDAFQGGRFEEAERHYRASLEAVPDRASTLINLAAVQLQLRRPAEALLSADQALRVEPDAADALLHRGAALLQLGRLQEASAAADRMIQAHPGTAAGWMIRAQAGERQGRVAEAVDAYRHALVLQPSHAAAWSGLGTLLRELAQLDQAAHAFRQAIAHGADPELNGYYLASVVASSAASSSTGQRSTVHALPTTGAVTGSGSGTGGIVSHAPQAYVRGLFDQYAEEFDQHVVQQLGYDVHRTLVYELTQAFPRRFESAVDLGCGTGLCGPLVRPLTDRLVGVDLSGGMLDKARRLGVYDELVEADLVAWLAAMAWDAEEPVTESGPAPGSGPAARLSPAIPVPIQRRLRRFDLALAADVFIYVGDLDPVFAALAHVMPTGVFCFSVELAAPDVADFQLLPSLRFAHSAGYLRRLSSKHGFEVVSMIAASIRQEQRRTIAGLLVYLSRSS
ncbi:MAG: putative methyltransferase, contains repeat [Rhizobacter sp.]|nr:putative methyltransferase, contains repeat [Rhizobacter sp.]